MCVSLLFLPLQLLLNEAIKTCEKCMAVSFICLPFVARGGNTAGGRIFFLRPSPFCVTQGFPSRTQKDIDMDLSIDAQWKTSFSRNPRLSHDTIFTFGDVEHVGHVKVGHTKTKRKKHVTKDGDNVHEAKKRRYQNIERKSELSRYRLLV